MSTFQHTYTVGLRKARCKIWHDPPCALPAEQHLSSIFRGSIAGANAKILLDSGAAANCISECFCSLMSLEVKPIEPASVTSFGGQADQVLGMTTVQVNIQSYHSRMHLFVIKMATDCDAILGEPWHSATKAVYQYNTEGLQTVRLYKGRTARKLTQTRSWEQSHQPRILLSSVQFARAARRQGDHFVAYVQTAPEEGGRTSTPSVTSKQDHSAKGQHKPEHAPTSAALEELLKKYEVVFQPLPKGLPPFRDVTGHAIPLQPGAIPPYRAPYRFSPLEHREGKIQIKELLEGNRIRPSRSPYGAPVLFVQKKDGTLRMRIDY